MNISGPAVPRVNVLGVGISALNMDLARTVIEKAVRERTKGYICVTGVHGVMEAQDNPEMRGILNRAFLCTPDGMPMVWYGKGAGHRAMTRVYGPDLMLEVCGKVKGCRHFLFGGSDGCAEFLKSNLEQRFPDIQIVGTYEPPWRALTPAEEEQLAKTLRETRPDVMWVGLSTPKQEKFMAQYLPKLEVTIMVGVGAAYDLISGRVKQAPRWIQRSGLEWLYRLCREPRRLWRRYLKNNPRFVLAALGQGLGIRNYKLEG